MRPPRPFTAEPRHPLTGRQFKVSAATERQLAAMLARIDGLRADLRLGMKSAEDVDRALRRLVHGPVTVERAAQAYISSGVARNTARRVRSFLSASGSTLAARELDELEVPVVSHWVDKLRARGMAPTSIMAAWRTLRAVVRFAHVRGWIGRSPWGGWRPVVHGTSNRRLREATRDVEELVRLLAAAKVLDEQRAARGRLGDVEAKIATVSLLGLRPHGELAGLRWPDVDELRQVVFIQRQFDGAALKVRRPEELRAAPELFALLAEHRAKLDALGLYDPAGPVFPNARESTHGSPRPYAHGEVLTRRDLRAVVSLARLPHPSRWSPYSLRDSFITLEAHHAHGDLRAVQERSRHASLASLVRYLRSRTREPAAPGFTLGAGDTPALALGPRAGPASHNP